VVRSLAVVGTLKGTAYTLGQFFVGRGDNHAFIRLLYGDDPLQRVVSLTRCFFVLDEAVNFVFVSGQPLRTSSFSRLIARSSESVALDHLLGWLW
jgi:hypothetical protein